MSASDKKVQSQKKIAMTLVADPTELAKLSEAELLERFHKEVLVGAIQRMRTQHASDPWNQWSYGFF